MIFLGGCNFKCGYCYNSQVVRDWEGGITADSFLAFLDKRKRFVDAVCVSGGEPTLRKDLRPLLEEIRARGYLIKLDTNGTNPGLLRELTEAGLFSYVAMDMKGPFRQYGQICGASPDQVEAVKESVRLLIEAGGIDDGAAEAGAGGFDYEFRTTVCRNLLSEEALLEMAEELRGAKRLYLQGFQDAGELLCPEIAWEAYPRQELERLGQLLQETGAVGQVTVR